MKSMSRVWRIAVLLTGAALGVAQAATLRIASAFDPQTMDPHADRKSVV